MKKYILVLCVLLVLLILTCVYQKTYTLYEKYHDTSSSSVLNTASSTPVATLKQEKTEVKVPQSEVIVPTPIKPVAIVSVLTTSSKKSEAKIEAKEISDSKAKVEDSNTSLHTQETQIIFAKKQDLEEIDSLLEALKRRDIALKYRDELILRIQQLIKQALDNRSDFIDHRDKEELYLLQLQEELLKSRDIAYDKVGQTNIPTSGK